ncbi:hypothetical protein AVBRAN9333_08525 [Campylobacter sp. RM9333]|uniref:hypothetical protein n=1 Tax=Campylobacter sp. RM9333 TaxID=2735731 RepID=UPI001D1E4B31|nr:hypothetical protein [Campylobacter sp. RM9333]
MSKELINIISKDDLKTLVNQVYEQKKIYRNGDSVKMKFPLLRDKYALYVFTNSVDLMKIEKFVNTDIELNNRVDDFVLNMSIEIEFYNSHINIDVYCYNGKYEADFDELYIQRTPESTIEETTEAIIELIEEINNKQSLFELVWSE